MGGVLKMAKNWEAGWNKRVTKQVNRDFEFAKTDNQLHSLYVAKDQTFNYQDLFDIAYEGMDILQVLSDRIRKW